MKHFKYILLAALIMAAFTSQQASAKRVVVPKMYLFGFAASFNDTIVHFTNVMPVDSVWMEKKKKFLLGRNYYSHQLRDYLATEKQMPDRTCVVQFAKTKEKAEKKLLKMRALYTKSKKGRRAPFDVRYLEDSEFRFKSVNILEYDLVDDETLEKLEKQKAKEEKKAKKAQKKKKKGGK